MAAAFFVVLLSVLQAAAVDNAGLMFAEIGVHHIEAHDGSAKLAPSSLVRRDSSSRAATRAGNSTPSSNAYTAAVLASKPVAYWNLGDLVGNQAEGQGPACGPAGTAFGDPCQITGLIKGAPKLGAHSLIPTSTEDKAISFDGSANQEIVIPDSPFLNTNQKGYKARTVELWFKAGDLGGINRTIYEEGNAPHSGISIYARSAADKDQLFMYIWDRGNNEVEFGTPLMNPTPLMCTFDKNSANYVALVYNSDAFKLSGYIKPAAKEKVSLCGEMTGMPKAGLLRHHGHGGGNAVIGGVAGTARATGSSYMDGDSHNFIGTIDEVAVYNRALPLAELQKHATAAGLASATEDAGTTEAATNATEAANATKAA